MQPTIASLIGANATAELSRATKGTHHLMMARSPEDLARNSAGAEIIVYDPRITGDGRDALTTYLTQTSSRVVCRMPLEQSANAWLVGLAIRRPTLEIYLGGREQDAYNAWVDRVVRVPADGTIGMIAAASKAQLSPAAMVFVCITIVRSQQACSVHGLASTFGYDSERWAQVRASVLTLPTPHWLIAAALTIHTVARLEAGIALKATAVLAGFRESDPLVRRVSRISGRSPEEWMQSGGLESALAWYESGLRQPVASIDAAWVRDTPA